ncbi:MAG TPA: hypothetical protein VGL09_19025 [Methylomirabilota bacterium]|jgi:hypothetical protein
MGRSLTLLVAALLPLVTTPVHAQAPSVVVNGVQLDAGVVRTLEQHYGTRIQNGRYWYDNVSGLWGFEGGPTAGRMYPGLRLGGPLRPDASRSNTGVFVNGRDIHPQERAFLQQCFGYVNRAHYWLNAQGIGGYDRGPAQFDLTRCFASEQGGGRRESLLGGYFLTGVSVIGGR